MTEPFSPSIDDPTAPRRWLDEELSARLRDLADRGESEVAEFKRGLPEQASTLAKEIAGFATSRSGQIFLGIEDDGTIIGVEGCNTHEGRNQIRSRIEGIVKTVQPLVHIRLAFAAAPDPAGDRIVIILDVPKGSQPIYYSRDIPYLRQMTATRPMTPDEVIAHIREWEKQAKPTADARYRGDLASLLIDIDVMMADKRARRLNPWAQQLRHDAGYLADQARRVAAKAPASLADTEAPLEDMAQALDTLARERPVLSGTRAEILGAMDDVDRILGQIRAKWLPPEIYGEETIAQVSSLLRSSAKQLAGLAGRLTNNSQGARFEDIRQEAGTRGMELLRCASIGVGLGAAERVGSLRDIALALRELETRTVYMDGGQSGRKIIEDLSSQSDHLQTWLAQMDEAH